MSRFHAGSGSLWFGVIAVFAMGGIALAVWDWQPGAVVGFDEITAWFVPHRRAWYALPVVMMAFVVLGLVLVPVILLIAATGVAFGPLLGPMYAMAGCLASASAGFAIGRWVGLSRVRQLAGERIVRVTRLLNRNGTLAVFLVRKVPVPFALANIVIGASTIRFRDFIVGTVLGMGAFVVGLAGFGYQLMNVWRDPSPASLVGAALFVIVPLSLALVINHRFRRLGPAE